MPNHAPRARGVGVAGAHGDGRGRVNVGSAQTVEVSRLTGLLGSAVFRRGACVCVRPRARAAEDAEALPVRTSTPIAPFECRARPARPRARVQIWACPVRIQKQAIVLY